jgi:hypothetical protein
MVGLLIMLRNKNYRQRQFLFCFMLMIIFVSSIYSYSGPDEPLIVITKTEPDIPFVGLEWKLSFLVDYPEANNVFAEMPTFPPDVVRLDRIRKEPELIYGGEDDGETWTRLEYFFVPLKPGQIIIPSIEIRTPEKSIFTSQMFFRVEAPYGTYVYQPELRWTSLSNSFSQGSPSELLLLMQNNDPQKKPEDFLPAVIDLPQDAILERLPLTLEDTMRNGILRLKIIPLKEGMLTINPIIVEYEGVSLTSPPLQMQVTKKTTAGISSLPANSLSAEELNFILQEESIPVREQDETVSLYLQFFPQPLKKQYDEIVKRTEKFWNSGEKAEALAFIRRAERDESIGFMFRPVRKNFEQKLGLSMTKDEDNIPIQFFLILCAVFFTLSIILLLSFFLIKKNYSSLSFFRILRYTMLVICIIASLISGAIAAAGILRRSGKEAPQQVILYNTDVYRVPEASAAVNGSFQEGESGLIRSSAGSWFYIETDSGQSGWVQSEFVIRY